MPTYTVVANIRAEGRVTPITWSNDGTIADVMVSVGQLIQHDLTDSTAPFRMTTETITITINHKEA